MKANNKYQTISPLEKEAGQIKDIYKMINQQEKYMEGLLSKYNKQPYLKHQEKDGSQIQQSGNRTLDPSYSERQSSSRIFSRGHSAEKINMVPLGLNSHKRNSLDLPAISPRKPKKEAKHIKSKTPNVQDPYFFFDSKQPHEQKDRMKQILQKAYLQDRSIKSSKVSTLRNRSPMNSKHPVTVASEQLSQPLIKIQKQSRFIHEVDSKEKDQEVPQPVSLGYFSQLQKESSSSEEGEVPLTYYEKQYRSMIRTQSLEETNFLYFSKNESMQGWTQGLLMLFQKHDKELAALRKKCRYLQKFDRNFFSMDIFCND